MGFIFMGDIAKLRVQIDEYDDAIWRLIDARARLALQIGAYKQVAPQFVGDFCCPVREQQILARMVQHNQVGVLPDDAIVSIYQHIMAACLALQQQNKQS